MEEKKCVGGYYRIRKAYRPDPAEEYKRLQKGYGTKHPERIGGWSGLFFGSGDVYVSERVGECMQGSDLFRAFAERSLRLFEKEGYGDISSDDEEINGENRWLGNGDLVMGRYGFYYNNEYLGKGRYDKVIRIRTWKGNTWITYDSEPDQFLTLKGNGEEPESSEQEKKTEEKKEPEQEPEKEGIAFLKEYRAHSEKYLPLARHQYGCFEEQEGDKWNLFWDAGIIEENRPYFAWCWEMERVDITNLTVFVSADGMERWDAEHLFIPKMIRRGLLQVDNVRAVRPAVQRFKDAAGHEFYMVHITLREDKPGLIVRWTGKKVPFSELNKLNRGG